VLIRLIEKVVMLKRLSGEANGSILYVGGRLKTRNISKSDEIQETEVRICRCRS